MCDTHRGTASSLTAEPRVPSLPAHGEHALRGGTVHVVKSFFLQEGAWHFTVTWVQIITGCTGLRGRKKNSEVRLREVASIRWGEHENIK